MAKDKIDVDHILKEVEVAYAALKPIAERSPMYDTRQLALIIMRLIETARGDEDKTELPARHHA
jgi:hypothetical protein